MFRSHAGAAIGQGFEKMPGNGRVWKIVALNSEERTVHGMFVSGAPDNFLLFWLGYFRFQLFFQ